MEFNPYEGKKIDERYVTNNGVKLPSMKVDKVESNSGFAPVFQPGTPAYEDNIFDGYAVPTGLFNQRYPNSSGTYPHEGVDFRGNYGREIKAFIYADVIGCGWGVGKQLEPYGRTIILGNKNGKGLYLLGHLQSYEVEDGDSVEPGDLVAKVGRSGYDKDDYSGFSGPHLHISYYDYTYDPNKKDTGYLVKGTNDRGEPTIRFIKAIEDELRSKTFDPFNHSIQRELS
jgi:murein DD-endopeptidase MepM/ murein hydrolase activator NlpD